MNSLIRSNRNLRTLQREIDSLFDTFFPGAPASGDGDGEERRTAVWAPRTDLAETDEAYRILLDVPGMTKEDLTINYQDNQLTVSGERKAETRDEGENFVRVERAFGHFYRAFTLPKTVQDDDITAEYEDGVLTIIVPKAEEEKPRRIEVQ
jgi:HSP20 family protein